jgi:hypothetical protein
MCPGKGKKDLKKPEPKESIFDAFGPFEPAVRDFTIFLISLFNLGKQDNFIMFFI